MKTLMRISGGFLLFLAIVLSGCASHSQPTVPDSQLKVGLAEVDITPPIGYRMAGYFDERLSTGVHDRLKAKAMVLQQGSEKIALVFCDLVGMSLPVTTNARAQVSASCGIPVANISIFATHSHTGPLFQDVRSTFFNEDAIARLGYDPHQMVDYPAMLTQGIVEAIKKANERLAPGELSIGIGHQEGLPFNRRYYMKNGKVTFNPGQLNPNIIGPAGPVDSDVGVLMIDSEGKRIGGLTVFAMHADTTGGTEYSADYPYYIQESLRKAYGDKYVSMFGAGTCGDLNHIDVTKKGPLKGPEVAKGLGERIAKTVLNEADHLTVISHPSLAVADKRLVVPLQEPTPEQVAEAKANMHLLGKTSLDFYSQVRMVKAMDLLTRGKEWPMEVQAYRLDADTAIVGLPAEIFVEFGLDIKKRSPFKNTLVISINNDRPSYVPTLKAFQEGSYEVINSRVKPGVGEELADTAVELLQKLK